MLWVHFFGVMCFDRDNHHMPQRRNTLKSCQNLMNECEIHREKFSIVPMKDPWDWYYNYLHFLDVYCIWILWGWLVNLSFFVSASQEWYDVLAVLNKSLSDPTSTLNQQPRPQLLVDRWLGVGSKRKRIYIYPTVHGNFGEASTRQCRVKEGICFFRSRLQDKTARVIVLSSCKDLSKFMTSLQCLSKC